MLSKNLESANLYIGKNAGKQILQSINVAKSSIKIISPYISDSYIDLLIQKHSIGVDVSLITSTDIVKANSQNKVYKKIIMQTRHTNEAAKTKRDNGLKYTLLAGLISIVAAMVGSYFGQSDFLWLLALLPVLFIIFRYFNGVRIYNYTYSTLFRFQAIVSPHSQGFGAGKYLLHAKVFLIDDKEAFLGSVNFTKSAFRFNYETCIKLTGSQDIKALSTEYEYLNENDKTMYLNIGLMGSSIYSEPKN